MNAAYIFNLIKPCKNRKIDFVNNGDGSVSMDCNRFETMSECDNYLESKPRLDFIS